MIPLAGLAPLAVAADLEVGGAGDPVYGADHGAMGSPCVPEPEVVGDGIDQDCNGVDLCYLDADDDGVGGVNTVSGVDLSCAEPQESPVDGDCDDGDPDRFPGNPEAPVDGVDGDCDGFELCYGDRDGDGYGAGDPVVVSADWDCAGKGVSAEGTDCEPDDGEVSPGQPERCDNGIDDDCDGVIDDDAVDAPWYRDADGDEHGNPDDSVERCAPPAGFVADADDCDDGDPEVYPGAPERCDGEDQDCDGENDEGLPTVRSWPDGDGDGYGDPERPLDGCRPGGHVLDDGDCDDTDDDVHPGALELCNGIDDDCDGQLATCDLDSRGSGGGEEARDGAVAGCRCGSAGGIGWGWAAILIGAAGIRRRRR